MAVEHRPADTVLEGLLSAPSPQEIARRRQVMAETRKLRDAIGPIKMTTSELLDLEDDA